MQNIDDGGGGPELLASLTNDELIRYGEIAADQLRLEWRWGWAQGLAVLAAAVFLVWGITRFWTFGFVWSPVLIVGLAAAFGYWPYQKARMRQLWRGHVEAVEQELDHRRRRSGDNRNGNR